MKCEEHPHSTASTLGTVYDPENPANHIVVLPQHPRPHSPKGILASSEGFQGPIWQTDSSSRDLSNSLDTAPPRNFLGRCFRGPVFHNQKLIAVLRCSLKERCTPSSWGIGFLRRRYLPSSRIRSIWARAREKDRPPVPNIVMKTSAKYRSPTKKESLTNRRMGETHIRDHVQNEIGSDTNAYFSGLIRAGWGFSAQHLGTFSLLEL